MLFLIYIFINLGFVKHKTIVKLELLYWPNLPSEKWLTTLELASQTLAFIWARMSASDTGGKYEITSAMRQILHGG